MADKPLITEEELTDILLAKMPDVSASFGEARALARKMLAADLMYEALNKLNQPYRGDWNHMTAQEKEWANQYSDDSEARGLIEAALFAIVCRLSAGAVRGRNPRPVSRRPASSR